MELRRTALARQVLDMLTHGHPVPAQDAFRLRNWALHPDDAMLSLDEIAYRILKREGASGMRRLDRCA